MVFKGGSGGGGGGGGGVLVVRTEDVVEPRKRRAMYRDLAQADAHIQPCKGHGWLLSDRHSGQEEPVGVRATVQVGAGRAGAAGEVREIVQLVQPIASDRRGNAGERQTQPLARAEAQAWMRHCDRAEVDVFDLVVEPFLPAGLIWHLSQRPSASVHVRMC